MLGKYSNVLPALCFHEALAEKNLGFKIDLNLIKTSPALGGNTNKNLI